MALRSPARKIYRQQQKQHVLKSMRADPCWTGFSMVGMKKKNGHEVPNCVPASGQRPRGQRKTAHGGRKKKLLPVARRGHA